MSNIEPRIYVACLASYNSGVLHGAWIDANQDPEDIHKEIQTMLKNSPEPRAEEYAIHDYELEGLSISEYESIDTVSELAGLIAEHGGAYVAYVNHVNTEYATESDFEDTYVGEYDSEKDFAEEEFENMGYLDNMPDQLQSYIDYERYARDIFIDAYYSVSVTGGRAVYVFRRN